MELLSNAWEYADLPLLTFLVGYIVLPRPKWADKALGWAAGKIR